MNDDDMTNYKEIFTHFDLDGNGTVSKEELLTIMKTSDKDVKDASLRQMNEKIDEVCYYLSMLACRFIHMGRHA